MCTPLNLTRRCRPSPQTRRQSTCGKSSQKHSAKHQGENSWSTQRLTTTSSGHSTATGYAPDDNICCSKCLLCSAGRSSRQIGQCPAWSVTGASGRVRGESMLWLGRREAPHRSMRGAAAGAAVREKFGWPRREVQIRGSLEGRAAPARAEACSVGVEAGEAPYGGEGEADARSGGEGAADARSGGGRGGVFLTGIRTGQRRPRREACGAASSSSGGAWGGRKAAGACA